VDDDATAAVKDAADAVEQALHLLERAADVINRGEGGREVALAKTNVEQGGFWLDAALRAHG
jgi:hypothetical protein